MTGKHEYKSTLFMHAADPGQCLNSQCHDFRIMGMIGIPIPDDNTQVQIVNRFYCTRCMLIGQVEDHKVPMQEVDNMKLSSSGHIQ